MFELLKRRKGILLVVILMVAVVLLVLTPTIKQAVKDGPLYERYSKWRYNWRSPSDLGDGKDASQIIIEGPMGLAEDDSGKFM